jgi:hypothetical protein
VCEYMIQSSGRKCYVIPITDQVGVFEIDSGYLPFFDQVLDFVQIHIQIRQCLLFTI